MARACCLVLACAAALAAFRTPEAAAAPALPASQEHVRVHTVPAQPGVILVIGGRRFVTGRYGSALVPAPTGAPLSGVLKVADSIVEDGVRASHARWYGNTRLAAPKNLVAALDLWYRVDLAFVDLQGRPIPRARVSLVKLKGSHGVVRRFRSRELDNPQWLQGSRVISTPAGAIRKPLYYTVESVIVDGTNVVNRSQQRFFPRQRRHLDVRLLFFTARVSAHDALLRFPIGSGVRLTYPDGHSERHEFGPGAEVVFPSLPRGEYWVTVDGPGMSFLRPVALSRNQEVRLEVLSYLDMALVGSVVGGLGLGLLLLGRPYLPRRLLANARALASLAGRRVLPARRPS